MKERSIAEEGGIRMTRIARYARMYWVWAAGALAIGFVVCMVSMSKRMNNSLDVLSQNAGRIRQWMTAEAELRAVEGWALETGQAEANDDSAARLDALYAALRAR